MRVSEKSIKAVIALRQKYGNNPPKALIDRYGWRARFEAVYRICHGGKPRPK